jgi:PAS domain S-box-containing protein
MITDIETLTVYQTYKGWFFVIITSVALYVLIKKHDKELSKIERESDVYDELLQKLFDRIPVMITMYQPNFESFTVNKAFESRLGFKNKDIKQIDAFFEDLFPNPEIRQEVFDYMGNPGKKWREFILTSIEGEKVQTSWSNIRLSDNTQIGIGLDLTEIKQKEHELTESKRLLEKIVNTLKESVILVEPETRVIRDCNQTTVEIFGYSKDELIGNTTELLHVDDEHFKIFDDLGVNELEDKNYFQTEFKLKKKNGDFFDSDHTVTFVNDEEGIKDVAVSVIRDISTQKQYERELMNSLKEKETLLQEVHHRVKNNLALVVSFLWLQKEKVQDEYLNNIFADNILRIKSIALIHELLYQSEQLSEIEVKTYFKELIGAIRDTLQPQMEVNIKLECEGIFLNVNQALPCALIVNELISNALKHAFQEENGKDPLIHVNISEVDEEVYLKVSDNGVGIPDSFSPENYSMGYNLINALVKQLEADFKIKGMGGTTAVISFEKKEVRGAASGMI